VSDLFSRKRPCGSCPFRSVAPKDRELPGEGLFLGLSPARVGEIAASLREGAMFPCHKTVDYSYEDDDETCDEGLDAGCVGGRVPGAGEHWCAGALATLLNTPMEYTPAILQIAQRLGLFRPRDFTRHSDMLYPDLDAWVAAMTARYARMGR
jgi:hypothetical protein